MWPKLKTWYLSTFGQALAGAIILWAALPPLDLWPLAYVAPVWWVLLIRRMELSGKRPYHALWLAGFLFWMAAYYWLCFPHPATVVGLVALSFYLGFYLPIFVGLSRVAVHQLRVPVVLAAPIVWTGLELARAHVLTGITMASLGHTQYQWIWLIQLSDLFGAYGVSFVVMLVAACLGRMLPMADRPRALWPLVPAAGVVAAALVYGAVRTAGENTLPGARVALIQGSIDSEVKSDPKRKEVVQRHYLALSRRAVASDPNLDLMIWPETMVRFPLISYDDLREARMPEVFIEEGWSRGKFEAKLVTLAHISRQELVLLASVPDVPMLLGVETEHYADDGFNRFNSAVLVDPSGDIQGPYHTMHRVMFGEYVPFGEYFGPLQKFTPLPVNLSAGERPAAFETGGLVLAPNICYETVLPHVIRRQVLELGRQGREPDVLVNLTNDGWFRGSSELDLHLICGIFRAVECRKPLLIAANTGFSAWIDGDGRVRAQGPRRKTAALLAEVRPEGRTSWYLAHGDLFAGTCLVATLGFAAAGLWGRWRRVIGSQ